MKVRKATELYTLKWLVLHNLNFISISLIKRLVPPQVTEDKIQQEHICKAPSAVPCWATQLLLKAPPCAGGARRSGAY